MYSCKEKHEELEPQININKLETDFMNWWTYHCSNISLSANFIGLNEVSEKIDKNKFLKKLTSKNFIPLRLKSGDGKEHYQLYKLGSLANKGIRNAIKEVSLIKLKYLKMEGMNFPEFGFKDFDGNKYTNESTKGKTILIKTWFIKCKACIAEFPELNAFVEKYKENKDIVFLSLALDSQVELEKFLKKKPFSYSVVPNQTEFIHEKLNLQSYPTHIILNEDGIILKVVDDASEMISFLENGKYLK